MAASSNNTKQEEEPYFFLLPKEYSVPPTTQPLFPGCPVPAPVMANLNPEQGVFLRKLFGPTEWEQLPMALWLKNTSMTQLPIVVKNELENYTVHGYMSVWSALDFVAGGPPDRHFSRQQCEHIANTYHDIFREHGTVLPVGAILFEGVGSREPNCVEAERHRVTSTSWHINAALHFLGTPSDRQLLVHHIMSPDIKAINVQQQLFKAWKDMQFMEAEVLLQPGIHMHIDQYETLAQFPKMALLRPGCKQEVLTKFQLTHVHVFSGDKCPCRMRANDDNK